MTCTVKGQCLVEVLGLVQSTVIWHTNVMEPSDSPRLPFRLRSMISPFGTFPKPWQSRALDTAFDVEPSGLQSGHLIRNVYIIPAQGIVPNERLKLLYKIAAAFRKGSSRFVQVDRP